MVVRLESRRRERRSGWWFRSPSRRAFWIVKSTVMLGVGSMPQHFERWYSTNTSSFGRDRLDTILCYISIEFWKWARPRNGKARAAGRKNVRHLIECSSTHTCNAARSGVVHTPSHGRTNFGSEAPRLSPTLFPSHLRRSCVSGYLFCSVGCIPLRVGQYKIRQNI